MNKNVNKDTPKATSTFRVDSLMSSVAVSYAEIYWAMKVLWSHLSYRSCLNLNDFFWEIVPRQLSCKVISAFKNRMYLLYCFWFSPIF